MSYVMRTVHITLALLLVLATAGCGAKDPATAAAASANTAKPATTDPNEIHAEPALLQRLKVGAVEAAPLGTTIRVAARVDVDENRIIRVGSPMMGRIASILIREGQDVKKGQTIAQLNSTGISGAQLEFLKAISRQHLAKRSLERAQRLVAADVIGAAELQRRETELFEANADLDAAHHQLILLGMPLEAVKEIEKTRALDPVSPIISTLEGTVMSRKVTPGQVVQPADTIAEIADLSTVWLVADVPEQNGGTLHEGQHVTAEIAALPGQQFHGQLTFVSNTVNPETRTIRARMELANPKRRLKPAMLATMEIRNQVERHTAVPLTAIVRENETQGVFVERAPGIFVLKPCKFGLEYGNLREVVEGVNPGDRIVLDGAFHLNNERRRRALSGSGNNGE
ncbi:hemolysin secretion protein D [Bryobacterales bacterium F-183]|nr:hemolysin secretion protein D [Bryobacterales bacterium F-183]